MRRIFVGVALAIFVMILAFLALYKREQRGTEFCPQTFELRSFVFYVNAFGKYNMDRASPNPCEKSIADALRPVQHYGMRKRWDLVVRNPMRDEYEQASILVKYLTASSSATGWNLATWSNDHPEIAAQLWPRVQDLAVYEMYFAIPELIRNAISAEDASEFVSIADQLITAASEQKIGYWMSRQRDLESDVRLLRLVRWFENSGYRKDGAANSDRQRQIDVLISNAKSELGQTFDTNLPGEELVKGP